MNLQEFSVALMLWAVCIFSNTVPRQGIHGQLIQGPTGRRCPLHTPYRWVLPRGLCWVWTGAWRPPAVAEAGYSRVWRGGGEWADKLAPGLPADLLVLLDVDVNYKNGNSFSHNKGESAKVEGPTIGVGVFLVIVSFVTGVPGIAWDVDNDADDVAQTWKREKE